jgi:hypothetical protein
VLGKTTSSADRMLAEQLGREANGRQWRFFLCSFSERGTGPSVGSRERKGHSRTGVLCVAAENNAQSDAEMAARMQAEAFGGGTGGERGIHVYRSKPCVVAWRDRALPARLLRTTCGFEAGVGWPFALPCCSCAGAVLRVPGGGGGASESADAALAAQLQAELNGQGGQGATAAPAPTPLGIVVRFTVTMDHVRAAGQETTVSSAEYGWDCPASPFHHTPSQLFCPRGARTA